MSQFKLSEQVTFGLWLAGIFIIFFFILAPIFLYLLINFASLLISWYEWLGKILPWPTI
jgi:hypothetical protein